MIKKLVDIALAGAFVLGAVNFPGCVAVEKRTTIIPYALRMVIPWEEIDKGKARPKTLEEIAMYQQSCIKPALEWNHDDWKSAERTHKEGYGDCEDYAINAAYFMEKIGYDPLIMIFPADGKVSGHAVAVFKKTGEDGVDKFGYIEYGVYGAPIYKSFEELAEALGKMHAKNRGIEYAWKSHVVLDLNYVNCDWRHGKENLQKYFEKFALIKKN